jgi:hypothetical protein
MRHFLSINDLSRDEAQYLLAEAGRLKNELADNPQRQRETLACRTLAMVFEKPSLAHARLVRCGDVSARRPRAVSFAAGNRAGQARNG